MTDSDRAKLDSWRAVYVLRSFHVGPVGVDIVRLFAWRLHRPQWFMGFPGFWYAQFGPVILWWINEAEARKGVLP